jgi:pimeloyl-ACP methyl ester carboxylesterase
MDLLTENEEERERATVGLRFDIDLLARRLIAVTDWAADDASTKDLPIGYFGASTGAAAALVAAAQRPQQIATVVSRGGRPDLARSELSKVRAPTLLIVGRDDPIVLELNRDAYRQLHSEKRLAIVPHATHLFEEPGALERVAELTRDWFEEHLGTEPSSRPTRAAQHPAPSH